MYKGTTVLNTRPVPTESAERVVPFYPQPGMAVTPGSVSTPASCPPRRVSDGVCLGTTVPDTHVVSAGTAGSTFLSSPFPDEDRVEERIDSRVARQRQQSLKAGRGGALKFPSPLTVREAEESGQSGLMHSSRLHGQSALSEITRTVSGVDKVITGFTPIPQLSMGDSSSAHHTASSGFSRAESAGSSSDVTAGLVFYRPPSLLSDVSPSFSSSTVEKSVIAYPFRGSLPMGCTSATDGVVETVIRSEEKVTALLSEIANLREKGAIDIVPRDQRERGFYSPYFLVPKRTGEMRPILDLRILDRCVAKRPFRMLTVKRLLE
ncbi:hypothetical protein DPEC_G00313790 [Dallia pectoralis]|uniref:Uncharacterized protein n=1 Tax=Dallia pectoralis TaxID=75939 RepID=A0ACC2FBU5_DALPE|nr:hypothetical protein DPEC_G00313790 [Dallia pectoralis]